MLRQFNLLLIFFIVHFQTAAFRCSLRCHHRHHHQHRHHCQRKLIVLTHMPYNIHMTLIFMSFFSFKFGMYSTHAFTNVDFYMEIAFKSLYLSRWQFPFYVHLLRVYCVFFLRWLNIENMEMCSKRNCFARLCTITKARKNGSNTKAHRKFHIIFSFQLQIAQYVPSNAYEQEHVFTITCAVRAHTHYWPKLLWCVWRRQFWRNWTALNKSHMQSIAI